MIAVPCKAGELVQVRPAAEILATLDAQGCLDGMPFMPEMLQHCGRQLRVAASAHKTCDSTFYVIGRELDHAVFLEDLRCDGSAHGGCEAKCLLFFKLAWLKPVQPLRDWKLPPSKEGGDVAGRDAAWLNSVTTRVSEEGEQRYRCQATEHLRATRPFKPNAWRMFWADYRSGNAGLRELAVAVLLQYLFKLRKLPFGWRLWTRLYESVHRRIYAAADPHIEGRIPLGQPTPEVRLGLQSGETVRVRSMPEIAATINTRLRNRGLAFNPEMSPFCGRTYRVERVVKRIVDERNGRMLDLKGPCVMLEGGVCQARYHPDAVLCRRRIPQYFREAWLERVAEPAAPESGAPS